MHLLERIILNFFVAFGIVIGGSLLAALGSFLVRKPPMVTMTDYAEQLKIWGLVGALGGTFDSFMQIDRVFNDGQLHTILRQIILIVSAFAGAHTGFKLMFIIGMMER
ncbi:sporulation protein [Ammoniphilus oxalaticus]|uniref:Sporulation protein n=1 Tax=Ammoniphilus oxalaticus TaxID=66863 RepID=A0A419SIF2_9BACL|nr:YtrH family sporulation protein [Ammoniphilus oxalaticus]RKD23775.1 sporulation protein [Ammoniphilus oxalaticus]